MVRVGPVSPTWSDRRRPPRGGAERANEHIDIYLVDPASSYMLVSKIKPCMSKYIPRHGETVNGSLNRLLFIGDYSGEGAWETATISKESSRRANYPLLARGGSDEK